MPTLSSVPEEEQRSGELRKQIQDMMTSMPEGVVSTRDIKLQYSTTDYIWVVNGLESLINQQIKAFADEVERGLPDIPDGSCQTCQLNHPKAAVKNNCIHLGWLRNYKIGVSTTLKDLKEKWGIE